MIPQMRDNDKINPDEDYTELATLKIYDANLNSYKLAAYQNSKITVDVSRDELEARWRETIASPVAAASCGAVDDILSSAEIRSRVCSALYLLGLKGSADGRLHIVSPV